MSLFSRFAKQHKRANTDQETASSKGWDEVGLRESDGYLLYLK